MRRFPGRTLEELDSMDYGRWMRAVQADSIEAVERRRKAAFENKRQLSADDLQRVVEHDRWLTAE